VTEHSIALAYLEEARRSLRGYKRLAEGAFAQMGDVEFFFQLDPEANSVAIIIKHMSGNMHSRFTDFLTSDGEKPSRNRDQEFILDPQKHPTRAELLASWEAGWQLVFDALAPLEAEQLAHIVTIRGEPHTVLQAIHRQVAHYAYHVGQIVLIAKHLRGERWKSLSVPKGKSAELNTIMAEKAANREVRS